MNIDFIKNSLKKNGKKIAVISNGKEYTFENIFEEYEKALSLLEEHDIQPGAVVALFADFSPISIALMIALIERNVIIVPISETIKQVDLYLRVSQSEYYIDATSEIVKIEKIDCVVSHEMLLQLREEGNPGLILFSSGTTGEPKAAVHNLVCLMEKFKKGGKVLRTISFLLFDHIGGFNTLMHSLSTGGTIVTVKTRSEEEVCSLIEKYHVELLPTSPTFLNIILLSHVYERYDLSSLKIISYGTEPMPQSTLEILSSKFPDIKLKQTYGLSEVGILASKSEKSDSLWIKLGGDGYELKIEDDILFIRAKSAMLGYLNAPNPFDEQGWFNTKDKVVKNGEYIKILGRTTDIINVGGEKVYPIEIESKLLEFDGVLDARVQGESNPLTGEIVKAELLVSDENNNRAFVKKVRKYCGESLERYKIPAKIILTSEKMYGDRFKKERG